MQATIKRTRIEFKKALLELGVSQHQMAVDLGISVTTVNRFLNGWTNLREEDERRIREYLQLSS